MVFADQGYSSNGAYAVQYDREQFYDSPPRIHGGQPLSFADGHAEYHKWVDQRTMEVTWATGRDFALCHCNQDLYWLQKVIWGQLGYVPSCPPEF
jgi:prepilin-type processing-associated H-X9-DG protein